MITLSMPWLGRVERRLLRIDARARTAALRQIHAEPFLRPGLERIIERFLDGYHLALASLGTTQLARRLDAEIELERRGFAFEGAGMYLAIADSLVPWRRVRLPEFMAHAGSGHDYIIAIGVGFATARLPWLRARSEGFAARLGPGLAGLVLDGFGFHEGFFQTRSTVERQQRPPRLDGLAARCFDMGVGRALWFVEGASAARIGATIGTFSPARQADLWAGVGLACAYAGSAYADLDRYAAALRRLRHQAGPHAADLGLGVVFAAETRRKAGNPSPWTSRACETLLAMSFEDAACLGFACWDAAVGAARSQRSAVACLQAHRDACDEVSRRLTLTRASTC